MSLPRLIYALLVLLPDVIKFIEEQDRRADGRKLNQKIKEDMAKINDAFKERNAEKLNEIFRS